MNNRPFISVVMPIYNVEKHLEKAIESVLAQTFQNFEIILVDDCSPDSCPQICDAYVSKYEKISVIHHEKNKGLSGARNTGLDVAKGEYIWFMDSDDYVDSDLFQHVYEAEQKNPAEVTVFGLTEEYYEQDDTLHHTQQVYTQERYYKSKEELREAIIDLEVKTLYGYAWNKFYNLDRIREMNLQYEKISLIEDILFNVKYFMDMERMNILSIAPYHYNKRMDNSLTGKFVPGYYELHKKRIELIYNQYLKWDLCSDNVKQKLAGLYARYIFSSLQRNCDKRAKMNHKQRKVWMNEVFQDRFFRELIPLGYSDSKLVKVMLHLLKTERTELCLILGRFIFIVKNRMPMIFAKVKQRR